MRWLPLVLVLVVALLFQPASNHLPFAAHNVLLLTAHPDDEAMFFAPTLRRLDNVYSLCLSTGDADRLGTVRRDELGRSLDILGVPPNKRWLIDHPDLQDNFTATWDGATIAAVVQPYVAANNITTILTFDAAGISGHPNHRSLPAVANYLPSLAVYTLITRPVLAKYSGILSPLHAKYTLSQDSIYPFLHPRLQQLLTFLGLVRDAPEDVSVVVAGIPDYLTALAAMRAHTSQLVWFRYLYVLFSRYMWVNEWVVLSQ